MTSTRKRSLEETKAAAEKKKQKSDEDEVTQRLFNGLYNQGATCYLNSVLQVLFMTTEIHDRLDPESHMTDRELRNMFEKLKNEACETKNIAQSLEIENVHQQRDAAECLEMILHKVSPQASEVFQGELLYMIKCPKDHSINEETNPFWTLPLSLKDTHKTTYNVEKGFERIFQTKSFSKDNMVYCNTCEEKTQATSACEMVTSPQILILLLKRFDFDYNTMSYVKSHCCADVPCELQTEKKKYKLYGMVNHMGGLRGGHYTATILSNEGKTWYEFDDSHVEKVEEQPFAKSGIYSSSTAYLLVYREASRSVRNKAKKQSDETSHLDEQRAVEKEGKVGQRDADDKENTQNQGSQGEMRKQSNRKALSEARFKEDITKNVLLHHKQNPSYSGKPGQDNLTKAEKRKLRSNKGEDEDSPQPCESSANITKNPLLIFLIVFGCVLILILPILITFLYRP